MRVIECNICGEPLAAATDDELLRRLEHHLEDEHEMADYDEQSAREAIEREAYDASDS